MTTADKPVETDVVVVGGGPVGLMLASELRAGGVQTLVLERLQQPAGHDRAGALHIRTVESLDLRGLLGGFLEDTQLAKGLPFAGMFEHGLDFSALDTRHPYSAMVPQSRTEELLAEHASALGAQVRRGHEVVDLSQDEDGVEVTVSTAEGSYRVRARYLVGCDGGRSTVRRLAGVAFPGTEATVSALIGYVTTPERNVPRQWQRTADGVLVLAFPPEGGMGRVVAIEYGRTPPAGSPPVTLDELSEAVERVRGERLALTTPVQWLSRFGDATRQAERYRTGRVFLAGDAAHVHFPIGGQGLNTGLQDAINLGWKLAARVRGWGSEELLDTYHEERHAAGERVLLNTRAQLALMRPDEQHTTPLRTIMNELLALGEANAFFAGMISGVSVRCAGLPTGPAEAAHPLAGSFAGQLTVVTGRGVGTPLAELLRSARPLVVVPGDRPELLETARSWRDRVDLVEGRVPERPEAAILVVRPDGYLAWAAGPGSDPAQFRSALARWFGDPTRLEE
ncbi:FAD-dependent monooxygenase [Kitasatospora sp. NPDC001540]|uniref:FAD-dependent monooxygenase n=1 Tax=Kitasatospora sp. NPDC001540 TaxID=3364014 RepID=UPI0036CFA69C